MIGEIDTPMGKVPTIGTFPFDRFEAPAFLGVITPPPCYPPDQMKLKDGLRISIRGFLLLVKEGS